MNNTELIAELQKMRGPYLGDGFTNVKVSDLLSALAADRAATAPDERAAFEAWVLIIYTPAALKRKGDGYMERNIDCFWSGWSNRARASLTAPDRAANSLAAPEGWKLVPVEPTKEMLAACVSTFTARALYAAMIAAAPSVPPEGVGREAEHGSVDSVERLSETPAGLGQITGEKP